jgi:hypothetical protein
MFDVFNQLTTGEATSGAEAMSAIEELPAPARKPVTPRRPASARRPRLRPVHIAALVSLAAVAALCYALSTQLHGTVRPCLASVVSTPDYGVPAPNWSASAVSDLSGPAALPGGVTAVHTTSCSSYSSSK